MTQTNPKNQTHTFPTTGHAPLLHNSRRVPVKFLPSAGWQVNIGHTPVKEFATPQTTRDNSAPSGYKPAQGNEPSRSAPVEVMLAAEKQRAALRHRECRAWAKPPINL